MSTIDNLALFPLGIVLYPGERLPLHIFEPQYKEMVGECLAQDGPFGIMLFMEGKLAQVGCIARIEQIVKRYDDGRLDLLVTGDDRFRVRELRHDKTYLTASVETLKEPDEPLDRALVERAITQHMRLLELAGRTVRPSIYQNVRTVSYILAHNAGLTPRQKQDVLELLTENERIVYLTNHFESIIPRVEQMEGLRRRIRSNGHFKDFPAGTE